MIPKTYFRWQTLAVAAVVCLLAGAAFVRWRAARAVDLASEQLKSEQKIRFAVKPVSMATERGFEWISAPAVFSHAIQFGEQLYLAGPAGLMEYDSAGKLLKTYVVGRELPPSPLGHMAVAVLADSREPELLIATAQQGILAFNRTRFRQILIQTTDASGVTTLLPLRSGHLLIGTEKRGVLVYDGKDIRPLHATLGGLHVTELAGDEADLWVGTLDRGVWRWHAGQSETFSEAEGLPDRQVTSIATTGANTYVGTPLGVAEFIGGRFARVLARGAFAKALQVRGTNLLVGTLDQGVISVPLQDRRANLKAQWFAELGEVEQLLQSGDVAFAVARDGVYQLGRTGFTWRKMLAAAGATLSDRNISALAAASDGRIWIGYFDRGLDVLDAGSLRATHVEDEHVFCVNRILVNEKSGAVDVATANGLVVFDPAGNQRQVLTRADGLIADHVTDAVAYGGGLALATPAGITFLDSDGARSLYAFHGLINNHVYALAASGDELLAGTLGGVSIIEKGNVLASLNTATSALKHNWITAVARVDKEWMLGTYGGGIFALDKQGHVESFQGATGAFEVNPNAMLVTERHVFAGTLGKGLWVFDRGLRKWTPVEQGLPSLNVTALAATNGYVYVGTDNGLVRIPEQNFGY